MSDIKAFVEHTLKDAESRLSARTVELQKRISALEKSHDAGLIHAAEHTLEAFDDLAIQIQELSNALEDDRKNTEALIQSLIEKKFAAFTTTKVKEIMRKEAQGQNVGNESQG